MAFQAIDQEVGDNIYEPLGDDFTYRQVPSAHSVGEKENPKTKKKDLSGEFVLTSRDFHYFGSSPIELPSEFKDLIVTRGHKCHFPAELVKSFDRWIRRFKKGVKAPPTSWSDTDTSWRGGC